MDNSILLDTDPVALRGTVTYTHLINEVQRAKGCDFQEAFKLLGDGEMWAENSFGPRTLRRALEAIGGVNADAVGDGVILRDRVFAGVEKVREREMAPMMLDRLDAQGRVMLATGDGIAPGYGAMPGHTDPNLAGNFARGAQDAATPVPLKADIGMILGDPPTFERRLQRARAAKPGVWDGDDGRSRFRSAGRENAEAGLDLVATLERQRKFADAQANARAAEVTLERAVAAGTDTASSLRLLDQELVKLGLADAEMSPAGDGLRLLDSPRDALNEHMRKLKLDQEVRELKTLEEDYAAGTGETDSLQIRAHVLHGHPELRDAFIVLHGAGLAMPTTPVPDPDATPPGVDPRSHQLHQRIKAHMAAEGLKPADYPRVLEQFMADGSGI